MGCLFGYSFYGFSTSVFIIVIIPLSIILRPFKNFHREFLDFTLHSYLAFLTRVLLPITQVYKIKEISGFERIPKDINAVYVANHQGKLDGPLILGILKNTSAVMKIKYASILIYSTLVKHLDFVSVDQYSRKSIEKSYFLARRLILRGKNLLVFPEGTRSISGRLLPFNNFAFKLAHDANVWIIPIIIYSNGSFMSKKISSYFPQKQITYCIRCLSPVKPLESDSPSDTAEKVRKIMYNELKKSKIINI
jgi:1-acyl-sn-glycerol-3-phosphate acyltransferase